MDWGEVNADPLVADLPPSDLTETVTRTTVIANESTRAALAVNQLTPPPIISPVVESSGLMSRTWVLWFQQLYRNRIGGAIAQDTSYLEVEDSFVSQSRRPDTSQADALAMFGADSDGVKGWVKAQSYQPQPPNSITKEITGFASPESVIVTYDSTTRKITLTGTVTAYFQGVLVNHSLVSGWVSSAHDSATDHIYFLYYNGSAFFWGTDVYPGFDVLMIATVFYRAVNKFALRECHGMMPWQVHQELHLNIGTYRRSGGDISGTTIGSTTAAQRRPDISACVIADEDLLTTNPALASKLYSQRYIVGTNVITYSLAAADIVPLSVNNPYYNSYSAPNWGQTLMPANSVQSIWLFEVPVTADAGSQEIRHVFVQGQWITQATGAGVPAMAKALADELLRISSELYLGNIGLISNEYVAIKRIVIQYVGGNWSIAGEYALLGSRYTQISAPSSNFISSVYANAPITGTGVVSDPLVIAAATTSVPGYLTSADWNTFSRIQSVYAFASLPAGATGMRAFVNNNSSSAAFGSAANGSGSTTYPVFHDGTSWKVG